MVPFRPKNGILSTPNNFLEANIQSNSKVEYFHETTFRTQHHCCEDPKKGIEI